MPPVTSPLQHRLRQARRSVKRQTDPLTAFNSLGVHLGTLSSRLVSARAGRVKIPRYTVGRGYVFLFLSCSLDSFVPQEAPRATRHRNADFLVLSVLEDSTTSSSCAETRERPEIPLPLGASVALQLPVSPTSPRCAVYLRDFSRPVYAVAEETRSEESDPLGHRLRRVGDRWTLVES